MRSKQIPIYLFQPKDNEKEREMGTEWEREREKENVSYFKTFISSPENKAPFSLLNFHWNETDVSISVLSLICKNDYP